MTRHLSRESTGMLRVEGNPALSGCLMKFWWAHQSSSGGADFRSPDPGALPWCKHSWSPTARRLTTGLSGQEQQRTGSWQSSPGTRRALGKPITPPLITGAPHAILPSGERSNGHRTHYRITRYFIRVHSCLFVAKVSDFGNGTVSQARRCNFFERILSLQRYLPVSCSDRRPSVKFWEIG
jgi:hypothetical protein